MQAQHHEAVQHLPTIKREETTKLEREYKEKKLRHKRLSMTALNGLDLARVARRWDF